MYTLVGIAVQMPILFIFQFGFVFLFISLASFFLKLIQILSYFVPRE